MTKRARLRWNIHETMARNVAGAGRNTAIIKVNDKYGLSTGSGGSLRARMLHHGPPFKKFW